eukprot:gene4230-4647_t
MPKEEKHRKTTEASASSEASEVKKSKSSSKKNKSELPVDDATHPAAAVTSSSDNQEEKKSKKHKKRSKEEGEETHTIPSEEGVKEKKKSKKAKVDFTAREPEEEEVKAKKEEETVKEDEMTLEEEEEEEVALPVSGANEVSLGERLELLSKQLTSLEANATNGSSSSQLLALSNGDAPTADSLVTLIDQALQSSDDDLLEQCLQCGDLDVISATTKQLPTHRILLFLRKLVLKFERRPSRGLLVTQWLAQILRHHVAYLITVPDLTKQLTGLSQTLEQRVQSYTRLSSLAGRLDLLMAQVSGSGRAGEDLLPASKTVFFEE